VEERRVRFAVGASPAGTSVGSAPGSRTGSTGRSRARRWSSSRPRPVERDRAPSTRTRATRAARTDSAQALVRVSVSTAGAVATTRPCRFSASLRRSAAVDAEAADR
jgi:hypothetical protein